MKYSKHRKIPFALVIFIVFFHLYGRSIVISLIHLIPLTNSSFVPISFKRFQYRLYYQYFMPKKFLNKTQFPFHEFHHFFHCNFVLKSAVDFMHFINRESRQCLIFFLRKNPSWIYYFLFIDTFVRTVEMVFDRRRTFFSPHNFCNGSNVTRPMQKCIWKRRHISQQSGTWCAPELNELRQFHSLSDVKLKFRIDNEYIILYMKIEFTRS